MSKTDPITAERIVAKYATAVASTTGNTPATTLADFADQLSTAGNTLTSAHITLAEEFDFAASLLRVAADPDVPAADQDALLRKAAPYLTDIPDAIAEYHLC
ncbi:hypothetical protein ACFWV1_32970 [Streptomyces sp. NPDC058700]|uniref:hypothetical protein n=1 Tax=unclassified Streptomyces TaxID=2593676 RepID=UPI003650C8E1